MSHCQLPCLAISLTLHHDRQDKLADKSSLSAAGVTEKFTLSATGVSSAVAFVSGLLLDSDANVRNWFSLCIRNGLKV